MKEVANKKFFLALSALILFLAAATFSLSFPRDTQAPTSEIGRDSRSTLAPKSSTEKLKLKFLVFGDSGAGSTEQKKLAALMVKEKADIAIHTGDLAYPSGTETDIKNNVFGIYQRLFKKVNFYPSLGNHDYKTQSGKPFTDAFRLPGNERYYSFDYGNTLFIALDTNEPLNESPNKMLEWFAKTLKNNAGKYKWVVVYFHHSPYSSGAVHGSDHQVQAKIVPILEKYKVDVVFSGHEHNYQRSCEILRGKCVKDGVLYIVTGGGGAPLYKVGPKMWFTSKQVSAYHYVEASVEDCKLEIKATDINGLSLDRVQLSKC